MSARDLALPDQALEGRLLALDTLVTTLKQRETATGALRQAGGEFGDIPIAARVTGDTGSDLLLELSLDPGRWVIAAGSLIVRDDDGDYLTELVLSVDSVPIEGLSTASINDFFGWDAMSLVWPVNLDKVTGVEIAGRITSPGGTIGADAFWSFIVAWPG